MKRIPTPRAFQVSEQIEHVDPGGRVEQVDDLVGDQELELEQQRAGDHQALQLASTQLVRESAQHVRRARGETALSEERSCAFQSRALNPGDSSI